MRKIILRIVTLIIFEIAFLIMYHYEQDALTIELGVKLPHNYAESYEQQILKGLMWWFFAAYSLSSILDLWILPKIDLKRSNKN